jgi:UDP-N-acetylglucosamine 4-epimerase
LMPHLESELEASLRSLPQQWLVTGAAGFIGSNLVETLLELGQTVVGLDNFATGYQRNLDEALARLDDNAKSRFRFIRGDIRDRDACNEAVKGVEIILHQAALGSVPRSIADPLATHDTNVTGFLNMLDAARCSDVRRFIYAASSSTYGDEPNLPKREERIGAPLSPYAVTKLVNEIYADVYARSYGFKATGLRYFNVFGPRQDPDGAYAAVIPRWTAAMIRNQQVTINGDGETSRDFCYVANAVQANIRAALAPDDAQGEVYNIAVGERTSLKELFQLLRQTLALHQVKYDRSPQFAAFSPGDVRHSEADIGKAQRLIGFAPTHDVGAGLIAATPWYFRRFAVTPEDQPCVAH